MHNWTFKIYNYNTKLSKIIQLLDSITVFRDNIKYPLHILVIIFLNEHEKIRIPSFTSTGASSSSSLPSLFCPPHQSPSQLPSLNSYCTFPHFWANYEVGPLYWLSAALMSKEYGKVCNCVCGGPRPDIPQQRTAPASLRFRLPWRTPRPFQDGTLLHNVSGGRFKWTQYEVTKLTSILYNHNRSYICKAQISPIRFQILPLEFRIVWTGLNWYPGALW